MSAADDDGFEVLRLVVCLVAQNDWLCALWHKKIGDVPCGKKRLVMCLEAQKGWLFALWHKNIG